MLLFCEAYTLHQLLFENQYIVVIYSALPQPEKLTKQLSETLVQVNQVENCRFPYPLRREIALLMRRGEGKGNLIRKLVHVVYRFCMRN